MVANSTNTLLSQCTCWVCDSNRLELAKSSNIKETLSSKSFAITDYNYGTTAEIHRCKNCGFLQCSNLKDETLYYEELQDPHYESTRSARMLQMKKIMSVVQKYKTGGRLLDIGASSGILVQEAIKIGFKAEGVEPSKWLVNKAQEYNLPVWLGVLPQPNITGPYDVITLIDIIEHVSNPKQLLLNAHNLLAKDGIVIVVTPDVGSLLAKILAWRWWHFRVAHIGYFNKKTLNTIFSGAGFQLLKMYRPSWYFTLDYLLERASTYLPCKFQISMPQVIKDVTVPLNLRDSILGIYTLKEGRE